MKLYNISVQNMIIRFHFLAAFIVAMGFGGLIMGFPIMLYIGIVLGMVVFLSTVIGLQIKTKPVVERVAETKDYFPDIKQMHVPARRYQLWHAKHHWSAN